MNTYTSLQGQSAKTNLEVAPVYGSIPVEHSEKDEIYQQILERTKEYVNWVAPVNILQGLDYMKIEVTLPAITKENCKVGCSGIFLWVKLSKASGEKTDTFYCTFILPENLLTSQLTASYEMGGKLVIHIPKQKIADSERETLFPFYN